MGLAYRGVAITNQNGIAIAGGRVTGIAAGGNVAYQRPPSTPQQIFLTATGAGSWPDPGNWNPNNNRIDVLGAGGQGGMGAGGAGRGGSGGGSGAWCARVNMAVTFPVPFYIPPGGQAGAATSFGTAFATGPGGNVPNVVSAGAGGNGTTTTVGIAGQVISFDPGLGRNGAAGGLSVATGGQFGGGGAGASGPTGNGQNGGAATTTLGGQGGSGDGGVTPSTPGGSGQNGQNGNQWGLAHGCGSGGNGASIGVGGSGGFYGAGSGGNFGTQNTNAPLARQGLIVISWTPP